MSFWQLVTTGGAKGSLVIQDANPLNANNPNYAVLRCDNAGNNGERGICSMVSKLNGLVEVITLDSLLRSVRCVGPHSLFGVAQKNAGDAAGHRPGKAMVSLVDDTVVRYCLSHRLAQLDLIES